MYSLDTNTNIAVERQAERMRAVQAVGQAYWPKAGAGSLAAGDGATNGRLPGAVKFGIATALLAAGMLVAALVR